MKKIYLDTETRSEVDLPKAGIRAYVEGEYFKLLLVSYAIDDGEAKVWQFCRGEPMPHDLMLALEAKDKRLIFSNSMFDRWVLNKSNALGFTITPDIIIDVMVQALEHGFPGSLGKLSDLFGLGKQDLGKLKSGKDSIRLFCVPQKGIDYVGFHDWQSMPLKWDEFVEYAKMDIVSMREIHKRLPTVNYPDKEHALWVLDQKIQDRGLPIDVKLAEAAMREAEIERVRLNYRTSELTDGIVDAATKRDKLISYVASKYGVKLNDLRTKSVSDILSDPATYIQQISEDETNIEKNYDSFPPELKELLEVRLQSSMNSATKYKKVIEQQVNGRMYNTLQFCGASRTGRDAGRGLQPQNLRRPVTWKGVEDKELERVIETDIALIKNGDISIFHDNVMQVLGDCVRGLIKAPKGEKFCVADLSNIEGRTLTWLAGEDWKLKYFKDFDEGKIAHDNYEVAYARAMNIDPKEVNKYGRQIGKVMELGLGYGGGVSAFLTFANVYNLDLNEMAQKVWDSGDLYKLNDAKNRFEWAKEKGWTAGLSELEFSACDYLKQLWRESHPATVKFWNDLEQAYRDAIEVPETTFTVGRLALRRIGQYLYLKLPSGRCIVYLQPKIDEDNNCTFVGVDQFTKEFTRIKTYSGKLSENVTSATARDILFYRMPDIEKEGYNIVLRVHDELITECPDTPQYTADRLAELMATPHSWCADIPLAAKGFETHRYRKD